MPDFLVTDPSGKQFKVSAPEGATQEQAFDFFKQQHSTGKIPQQEQMGTMEQFGAGLEKGIAGYGQTLANITKSPEEAAKVNLAMKMRDQQIQERGGLGVPGMVGGMVAQAPAMAIGTAAGGPLGAIAGGAIGGGLAGLAQPVTEGDYWNKKQDDILMGMVTGGGTAGALRLLGGFLGPKELPEAQKWLMKNGVQLTPGQIIGDRGAGIFRRIEEAAKSFPILGRFIAGAEGRGLEGFQRAIGNQVLEPIGGKLTSIETGPAMIKDMQLQLDGAYDNLLPKMKLQLDHDLSQDLGQIRVDASQLPEQMEKQFNSIVDRRLMPLIQAQGAAAPGTVMKEIDRAFRDFARDYSQKGYRQADPDAKMMGDLFNRARTAIRDAMGRQNAPQQVQELRKIDQSYAMLARVEQAAQRRATSDSRFTASDLLNAIRSQDKSVRHRSFGAGDELLQVYARYGQKVLPGKLPDSGTPERYMYDRIVHENALTAALDIGGAFTAGAPYTRPGMAIGNALARQSPTPFRQAGTVIRGVAPAGGVAGAVGAHEDDEPEYGGPQQ